MATNLLHHGSQNRIQKTSRNMAARKGPRLYKKQSGTQERKSMYYSLILTVYLSGECMFYIWGSGFHTRHPQLEQRKANLNVTDSFSTFSNCGRPEAYSSSVYSFTPAFASGDATAPVERVYMFLVFLCDTKDTKVHGEPRAKL